MCRINITQGIKMDNEVVNNSYVRVSKINLRYFEVGDSCYIPIGANMCFPRYETDEEKVFATYRHMMEKLSQYGGNYLRIWLSFPFFELEPCRLGEFDSRQRMRLERLLQLAAEFHLRVKITLEHFRTIDSQSDIEDYLGTVSFIKKNYHCDNGGTAKTMLDFFTGGTSRRAFLSKLDYLSKFFRNNPAIFAWELWNEINAVGNESPLLDAWMKWSEQMLPEVRQRFPNHQVTQSLGSFDAISIHRCYEWLCRSQFDFAQVHRYIDPGADLDICSAPMDLMCHDAIAELRRKCSDRPILLAETGAVEWRHCLPSHLYQLDCQGTLLHDALFAPFFSGSAGAGQLWHWDVYLEKHDLWYHFGRFARAIAGIDPCGEDYQPYIRESHRLRLYTLCGKTHTLIWARDKYNNWHTELDQKIAPEKLQGEKLDLRDIAESGFRRIEYYLPWEDTEGVIPIKNGVNIELPNFVRSIVLRLYR